MAVGDEGKREIGGGAVGAGTKGDWKGWGWGERWGQYGIRVRSDPSPVEFAPHNAKEALTQTVGVSGFYSEAAAATPAVVTPWNPPDPQNPTEPNGILQNPTGPSHNMLTHTEAKRPPQHTHTAPLG